MSLKHDLRRAWQRERDYPTRMSYLCALASLSSFVRQVRLAQRLRRIDPSEAKRCRTAARLLLANARQADNAVMAPLVRPIDRH